MNVRMRDRHRPGSARGAELVLRRISEAHPTRRGRVFVSNLGKLAKICQALLDCRRDRLCCADRFITYFPRVAVEYGHGAAGPLTRQSRRAPRRRFDGRSL